VGFQVVHGDGLRLATDPEDEVHVPRHPDEVRTAIYQRQH
jgi:hypothetical protein